MDWHDCQGLKVGSCKSGYGGREEGVGSYGGELSLGKKGL